MAMNSEEIAMKKRIIIIEDEAIIAISIKEALEHQGYEVVGTAMSGEKALTVFYTTPADLVLLDIAIKGTMDGIELAKVIRDKYKMPFIFLTSFSDAKTLAKVKETMPYGYIVKPFTESNLKSNIELALHKFEMENQDEISVITIQKKFNVQLSKREVQVLKGLHEGLSYADIAEQLFISINTVKTHQKKLYALLGVNSKQALSKLLN